MAVATSPPDFSASSTRSNDSAEISTPDPNAMTEATTVRGTSTNHAKSEPTTRAEPARSPQPPACSQIGTGVSFRGGFPDQREVSSRLPNTPESALARALRRCLLRLNARNTTAPASRTNTTA